MTTTAITHKPAQESFTGKGEITFTCFNKSCEELNCNKHGTGVYISIKSMVWSVRVRAFCRGLFVCVWVWGFETEILSHAVDGPFICMRWNPWAGSDVLTDAAAARRAHSQTNPHRSAAFQQHPAREQTGWQRSSGRGVKRWHPKHNSEPSARPNEASQRLASSVEGCKKLSDAWIIFLLVLPQLKQNPKNSRLTSCMTVSFKQAPPSLLYGVYAMQYLWSTLHLSFSLPASCVGRMHAAGFWKEAYLVSSFCATGTPRGGLAG